MKWIDAIVAVLQNNKAENGDYEPMHYVDITNAIIDGNFREKFGRTPQNTVNANITTHSNLFNSLGLGVYGLTEYGQKYEVKDKSKPYFEEQHIVDDLEEVQEDSDPIDFKDVRGIYLLYEGREVVYVGQALDSPIVKRLKDHTRDRLSGRWDRFSWFGLDGVNPDGSIVKVGDIFSVNISDLINSLEGILIEGLEPRQNRKQGNKFGDEYIQVVDYEIQKEQALKVCIDLLGKK